MYVKESSNQFVDEIDDRICIAKKVNGERCQNSAHDGFVTCGIISHRKQKTQSHKSEAEILEPIGPVLLMASTQADIKVFGHEDAH